MDGIGPDGKATLLGRIVSVGVKISYTGTTNNEGGSYSCYFPTLHDNATVTGSVNATLNSLLETEVSTTTRRPCTGVMSPTNTEESTFFDDSRRYSTDQAAVRTRLCYPLSNGVQTLYQTFPATSYTDIQGSIFVGAPVGLITMVGTPGNTFTLEYIAHLEYSGTSVTAQTTQTMADNDGYDLVVSAVTRAKTINSTSVAKKSIRSSFWEALSVVAKELRPIALGALKQGAYAAAVALL